MKMIQTILICFAVGLWVGCEDKDTVDVPANLPEAEVLTIEWANRIDVDREIVGTDNTQHFGDWVLVGGDLDDAPTVKAFDKETGDLSWEYIHGGEVQAGVYTSIVFEHIYIAKNSDGIFGLDLNEKKAIWEIDFDEINFRGNRIMVENDGMIYFEGTTNLNTPFAKTRMLRFDPYTGAHEFFYTDKANMNSYSAPCFWSDINSGRKYMIVNEYPNLGEPPNETLQNMIAIDMESKEVVWRTENFTDARAGNVLHPPIIYKDIVITGGDWSIYAFDTRTGEQLWRYEFDYPWSIFNKTNHLLYDGRLYVNNGQHDVTCLDPETGNLIWNNEQGGANCTDNMVYYEKEDLLVFTAWGYGSVMVLDALTGETLHRERGHDNSQYNNDVVYDQDTDMFFTSTYKHAIGFKVRRP